MYNQIILLGVVVSMIFTEITGLSAGLIVPGYLVLALHSPGRIVTTLIMASVSVLLCRLASQWLILFGRRRFAFLILLTFVLNCVLSAWRLLPFSVIGILMPRYSGAGNRQTGILRCLSGNCRHYAFYGADLTAYRAKAARRVKGGVFA